MKRVLAYLTVLLAVAGVVAVIVLQVRSARPSPQAAQPQEPESYADESIDYLPLAVANKWEYRVTVPPKGDFFFVNRHIGEGAPTAIGRKMEQGVMKVSYQISAREGRSFRVQVLEDELGLFDGSDEVYLDEYRIGSPTASEGSTAVDFRVVKETPPIHSKGFAFPVCVRYMDNALIFGENAYLSIIPQTKESHDVTVPAGTFRRCMKQSTLVRPERLVSEAERREFGSRSESPMQRGWKTESYFAPRVGLVKQQQFDLDGNVLHTMELVAYSVVNQ